MSQPVVIGELRNGEAVDASLDDVHIYNRALTAAEAKQLYQLGAVKINP